MLFEPGDLRFRPDSGQMEEDLDVLQLALSNLIIYEQEELLEQHAQPGILLITNSNNHKLNFLKTQNHNIFKITKT